MTGKQGAAEWLREKAQSVRRAKGFGCKELMASEFGESCDGRRCADCYADLFERIAGRIDAERALPEGVEWPRFEDGELVKVGDDVEYKGETMRVYLATFYADRWVLWCSREGIDGRLSGSYVERVKRPAPEVLGADGAPIEVGDVVYYDGEPHPLTVVGITRDGKDALVDANGEESCVEGGRPQDFSHDAPKPALDADGVPIKVDETVYFVDGDARPLTVERIDANGGEPAVDLVYAGQILRWHSVNPEKLTHECPDSWEKLEEDANQTSCWYFGIGPENSSCDDCPHGSIQTGRACWQNAHLDIVRRAKALAKAGEVE